MQTLFAIPGGGTSSAMYLGWRKYCRSKIKLVAMDLPGRGYKEDRPSETDFKNIANELADEICLQMEGEGYSIFGYCLGALLAYEVCVILQERKVRLPEHVFLCGATLPYEKKKPVSLFERSECRDEIQKMFYRFFPPYLFPDKEKLDKTIYVYLEILFEEYDKYKALRPVSILDQRFRSLKEDEKNLKYILDFSNSFCEKFEYDQQAVISYSMIQKEKILIRSPVTLICGTNDSLITKESWLQWQEWVYLPLEIIEIEANHFNITENIKQITEILFRRIAL